MAEKILFEFRTEDLEDGCRFIFEADKRGSPKRVLCACPSCSPWTMAAVFFDRLEKSMKVSPKKSRRYMYQTLDLFEELHDDIYGGEMGGGDLDLTSDV